MSDLLEVFADPVFDAYALTSTDLRDLAVNHPHVARAVLALYGSFKNQREASEELASRLEGDESAGVDRSQLPSEEVNDLVQKHMNYFPELEEARRGALAEGALRRRGALPGAHPLPRQASRHPRAHRARRGGARRPAPVRRREEDPHAERAPADALAHLPGRPPDRASHAAPAHRQDRRRRAPDERRVARPRARGARQLLRGRRHHAVRVVPRGVPAGALRHRRHRAAVPRRLRAGLPPLHVAAPPGGRGRALPHDPHRRRGQHQQALQRERHPLRALQRRVPAVEHLHRVHDARG